LKRSLWLLVASLALTVGVATATGAGTNSANVKKCFAGGWQTLYRSDGSSFTSQKACVSYAAKGGTPIPNSQFQCQSLGGTYSTDPATDRSGFPSPDLILWTCNGTTADPAVSTTLLSACTSDGGVLFATGGGPPPDPFYATCVD